jgi:hypothetical protein
VVTLYTYLESKLYEGLECLGVFAQIGVDEYRFVARPAGAWVNDACG